MFMNLRKHWVAEEEENPHNQRFAGINSPVIPFGDPCSCDIHQYRLFWGYHHGASAAGGPPETRYDRRFLHRWNFCRQVV
jgi:hypothetical protein